MKTERRYTELRADVDKRQLAGVAVTYGEIARLPFGRERFEVRAFGDLGEVDVILNTMHRRDRPLARSGSGLELLDTPQALEVRAELPSTRDADDTLELVRSGVLRGLSIEFAATRERMASGVRSIQSAILTGIGVVDRAAYAGSSVEARGENLVRVLEGALPAMDAPERPAAIAALAAAAEIDAGTVAQILAGEIDHPPAARLRGFARVLSGVSFDALADAVIQDGGNPDLYRATSQRRVWL